MREIGSDSNLLVDGARPCLEETFAPAGERFVISSRLTSPELAKTKISKSGIPRFLLIPPNRVRLSRTSEISGGPSSDKGNL